MAIAAAGLAPVSGLVTLAAPWDFSLYPRAAHRSIVGLGDEAVVPGHELIELTTGRDVLVLEHGGLRDVGRLRRSGRGGRSGGGSCRPLLVVGVSERVVGTKGVADIVFVVCAWLTAVTCTHE